MSPRREGPKEAIIKLLVADLKMVISGLPGNLQDSVPAELQDEMRTLGEEDSTGKANEE
jgi:hypothetical protein